MPQQQSPWLETAYGWAYGENGWNTGMDSNLLKFSVLFDHNVDGIVASLPAAVNGQVHFLTADKRLYFAVGAIYYSTPVPKWFTLVERISGNTWQFNGTSLVAVDSPLNVDSRLDAIELELASLGSAAFEDVSAFATPAQLDLLEAQQEAYTDTLRADLSNTSTGASNVGYDGSTVNAALSGLESDIEALTDKTLGFLHASEFDLLGDGSDETIKVQAAVTAASVQRKVLIGDRTKTYKITTTVTGSSNCHILDFAIDASAMTGTKHALVFAGTAGAVSLLTGNVAANAFTIPVVDGSIFTEGEWVLVTVDTSYYPYSGYNVARGEWVQIRSISGNNINITNPLVQAYTTAATATLRKYTFVENVVLDNVTINGSAVSASNERGVCFRFARYFVVRNCTLLNLDQYACEISSCLKFSIHHNRIRGTFYDGVTGLIFYAIALLDSCQYFTVSNNQGSRSRHLVITTAASAGQGRWGQCMFGVIHSNVAEDCMAGGAGRSYAYEMHGTGQHLLWANNIANGCYSFMRIEGGSDSQVIGGGCNGYAFQGLIIGGTGNTVRNIDIRGVFLNNYTAEVGGIVAAIRFETSTVMENVTIDGVKVYGGAVANVGNVISIGSSTTCRNNHIKNIEASAGSSESTGSAVVTAASVTGFAFDDCDLFGWRQGYNFATSTSKLIVRGGTVENFTVGGTGFGFYSNGDRNICKDVHFRNINTAVRLDAASTNNLTVNNTMTDCTTPTPSNAGTANVVTPNYTV